MPRSARYATARGPSRPCARCSERPPTAVPEGHTIHRLARDLLADLGGRTVRASAPHGRFVEGAARIDGATVVATEEWGDRESVVSGKSVSVLVEPGGRRHITNKTNKNNKSSTN